MAYLYTLYGQYGFVQMFLFSFKIPISNAGDHEFEGCTA